MRSVGARVVLRGAGKEIDGMALVPAVDLVGERGECVVVRGSNGSGKTTLLSMVAGRVEPTTGTVTIDDVIADERDPCSEPNRARRSRRSSRATARPKPAFG